MDLSFVEPYPMSNYFVFQVDQATPDKSRDPSATFPIPNEKEIILRVNTNKGPQRMYAVLKKNEFRLCGAFTNFDM